MERKEKGQRLNLDNEVSDKNGEFANVHGACRETWPNSESGAFQIRGSRN